MTISLKKVIASVITIPLPKLCQSAGSKGHFAVYSVDRKRLVVPLAYLRSNIFRELLRISEEVFGLPKDGPIILPFDGAFLQHVLSVVKRNISHELEDALLLSLASSSSSSSSLCSSSVSATVCQELNYHPLTIHGF